LPLSYSSQSVNLADVYNSVAQSVVSINITATTSGTSNFFFSQQPQQEQGAGSGIIYNIAGDKVYIATNNHVIADADTVTVSLDDTTQVNATFVGTNADADLAIISVAKADLDKTGIPYTAATLGDSDALRVGDVVMAVGNAMGEGKTATSGIISGLNKQITVETTTLDVIQTNAAINPGNSGGALVNSAGEVIGINTAKLSESDVEGMGYAIPINEAKDILQSLMTNGSAVKPVIGVTVQTVDQTMMDTYDFPSLGAMVMSVTPGGGAEAAGLQVYDIIVECNGAQVQSVDDLKAEIAKCKVGDTVAIKAYTAGAGGNDYVLKDYSVVLQDGNAVTPKF
ncbi:MAG: trypsin-like peptidase domain-containing protein, partial [Defluviitaleaceae bacterium]|nr:trypsin-like peptidase domain-containing protein [Defluviitaleaceae bacterium]